MCQTKIMKRLLLTAILALSACKTTSTPKDFGLVDTSAQVDEPVDEPATDEPIDVVDDEPAGPPAGVCFIPDCNTDITVSNGRYMLACGDQADYDFAETFFDTISTEFTSTFENDFDPATEENNGFSTHVQTAYTTQTLVTIDSVVGYEYGDPDQENVHWGSRTYFVASLALLQQLLSDCPED